MARKKKEIAPAPPEPEMITIYADILQETDLAILISCGDVEDWLPLGQIEFSGEKGDCNVLINVPEWLADEKGLSDGQGYVSPETSTSLEFAEAPAEPATITFYGLQVSEDEASVCFRISYDDDAETEAEFSIPREHILSSGHDDDDGRDFIELTRAYAMEVKILDAREEERSCSNCQNSQCWPVESGIENGIHLVQCPDCLSWVPAEHVSCPHDNCGYSNLPELPNTCKVCLRGPAPSENAPDNWTDPDFCEVDEVPADATAQGEDDEEDKPAPAPYCKKLREETISATMDLTPEELNECGERMARSLATMADLEDQLDVYRKGINARIKVEEQEAMEASRAFLKGKEDRRVSCDVIGDYNSGELVWVEKNEPHREIKRRLMVGDERILPLPLEAVQDAPLSTEQEAVAETITADSAELEAAAQEEATITEAQEEKSCGTCAHIHATPEGDEESPCTGCGEADLPHWAAMPNEEGDAAEDEESVSDMPPVTSGSEDVAEVVQ